VTTQTGSGVKPLSTSATVRGSKTYTVFQKLVLRIRGFRLYVFGFNMRNQKVLKSENTQNISVHNIID